MVDDDDNDDDDDDHLVDADDVASVVRAGPLMGRVNWGPRDCCHLKYFLV